MVAAIGVRVIQGWLALCGDFASVAASMQSGAQLPSRQQQFPMYNGDSKFKTSTTPWVVIEGYRVCKKR